MSKFGEIKAAMIEELDAHQQEIEDDELLVVVSLKALLAKGDNGRPWRVICQRESFREFAEPPRRR